MFRDAVDMFLFLYFDFRVFIANAAGNAGGGVCVYVCVCVCVPVRLRVCDKCDESCIFFHYYFPRSCMWESLESSSLIIIHSFLQ